eukprot:jgi/Mesvir1/10605/Mv08934-RA.1
MGDEEEPRGGEGAQDALQDRRGGEEDDAGREAGGDNSEDKATGGADGSNDENGAELGREDGNGEESEAQAEGGGPGDGDADNAEDQSDEQEDVASAKALAARRGSSPTPLNVKQASRKGSVASSPKVAVSPPASSPGGSAPSSRTSRSQDNSGTGGLMPAVAKAAKDAFESLDVEGTGTIPIEQVPEALAAINMPASPLDLRVALSATCPESADRLDFEQFRRVVRYIQFGISPDSANTPLSPPSSVSMVGGLGSTRPYLNSGHLSDNPAVLSFVRQLEEHRRTCEREGRYKEAKVAAARLQELKDHEEATRKEAIRMRHLLDREDAERAHAEEMDQAKQIWGEKLAAFDAEIFAQVDAMKSVHADAIERLRAEVAARMPMRTKPSSELLNQRAIQEHLAKQGKYADAEKIRLKADALEESELEALRDSYSTDALLREKKMRGRQQLEMDSLVQRLTAGRDALERARVKDFELRQRRYKNFCNELVTAQKLELSHLDTFLDKQTVAGKRNTVIYETISPPVGKNLFPPIEVAPVGSDPVVEFHATRVPAGRHSSPMRRRQGR